jgi:hypothetical protein
VHLDGPYQLEVFTTLVLALPAGGYWLARHYWHAGAWGSVGAGAAGGALAGLVVIVSFLWDARRGQGLGMFGLALPLFLIVGTAMGAVVGVGCLMLAPIGLR